MSNTRPHDGPVEIEAGTSRGNSSVVLHKPAAPATGSWTDLDAMCAKPGAHPDLSLLRALWWRLEDIEYHGRGLSVRLLLNAASNRITWLEKNNKNHAQKDE